MCFKLSCAALDSIDNHLQYNFNKYFCWFAECILFLLFSMRSCDNMSSATDIFPITIIAGELSRYTIFDDEDGGYNLMISKSIFYSLCQKLIGCFEKWEINARSRICHDDTGPPLLLMSPSNTITREATNQCNITPTPLFIEDVVKISAISYH